MKSDSSKPGIAFLVAALVIWLVTLFQTIQNLHSVRWPHSWLWAVTAYS